MLCSILLQASSQVLLLLPLPLPLMSRACCSLLKLQLNGIGCNTSNISSQCIVSKEMMCRYLLYPPPPLKTALIASVILIWVCMLGPLLDRETRK